MFVSRSLKAFSASCSWAASCSNLFSYPSAVHFLFPLLFVVSLSSPPPPCCRQHSVLAVLSVEHELRFWKKRTLRTFMLFFSFVGMDSLAVLLASLVVTGDFSVYRLMFFIVLRIVFWCFRRDRVSFNMLWCWFITFCVAFYSCLHLRGIRGRQPDRQGGVRLRRIDAVGDVA